MSFFRFLVLDGLEGVFEDDAGELSVVTAACFLFLPVEGITIVDAVVIVFAIGRGVLKVVYTLEETRSRIPKQAKAEILDPLGENI